MGGCSSLTSLVVEEGNPSYDSRDNCNAIIETWSNKLVGGCKNTVIPNSVTSIGAGAFYGCGLTAIIIPNSVTSIGEGAFGGCSGLTSISIPNSVTSIDREAFYKCSGLTSVSLPNSVTSIGNCAFQGCAGLEEVISHIEEPFEISKDVFGGYGIDAQWFDFTTATLYVPVGTKAKYEATPAWNLFQNIVEKDLTSIKETVQQTLDTAVPVIYNLSGQKLTTPKKGLNIINGKKVVIK